jgi:hypothetical protein
LRPPKSPHIIEARRARDPGKNRKRGSGRQKILKKSSSSLLGQSRLLPLHALTHTHTHTDFYLVSMTALEFELNQGS